MSTSKPDGLKPERIGYTRALMPKDMTEAAQMMTRPLADAAALSALGFTIAGQAVGLWFGMFAGSMDATRRLLELSRPASDRPRLTGEPDFSEVRKSADRSSRAAVETLMATAGVAPSRAVPDAIAAAPAPRVIAKADRSSAEPESPADAAPRALPGRGGDSVAKSAGPDDLKAISGIGPKLEQVLNGLGISTYAGIAALTADEISAIEDRLGFKGRIARDDWVGQAKTLMARGRA